MVISGANRKQKSLLIGGSGFIGRHLEKCLGPEYLTVTYHRHPSPHGIPFDAIRGRLRDIVDDPTAYRDVVFLFGVTNPDACFEDRQGCITCNLDKTIQLAEDANSLGLRVVFFSSESVFCGKAGPYTEDDVPRPILLYGQLKHEAEQAIIGLNSSNIVVRLARTYGTVSGDGTLCMALLEQIGRGDNILCARDSICSPIHISDVTTMVTRLMKRESGGIYHVAGPEALSRTEITGILITLYERHIGTFKGTLTECLVSDLPTPERRPANISMLIDKVVTATGHQPGALSSHITQYFNGTVHDV